MKSARYFVGLCALVLGSVVLNPVFAQDKSRPADKPAATPAGKLVKISDAERAWVTKARESYPLKVCVTSDEKLGSMGDNAEYVYREKGKPDRLVILCCDGCEEDFAKDPAKYLAKIDAAAKAAKK